MTNKGTCIFLEFETVQGTCHEFCQNTRMKEINKVENGKKLICMGDKCGLAVYKDETTKQEEE